MGRKSMCSALGCGYDRTGMHQSSKAWRILHPFPQDLSLLLAWLKASGNVSLLNKSMKALVDCNFMCARHFQISDYKSFRHLKTDALPRVFCHSSPISDELMEDFARRNNALKFLHLANERGSSVMSAVSDHTYHISNVTSQCNEDLIGTSSAVNNSVEVIVPSDIDNSRWANPCQEELQPSNSPKAFKLPASAQIGECHDNAAILLDVNDEDDQTVEINSPAKWDQCKQYQRKKTVPSQEQLHLNSHADFLKLRKNLTFPRYITLPNDHTPTPETGDPMSRLSTVDKTKSLLTQEYVSSVLSALDADLSYSVFEKERKVEARVVNTSAPLSPRRRCRYEPSPERIPVRGRGQCTEPTPAAVTVPLQHIVQHIQQHYLSVPPPLVPINQVTSEINVVRLPELRLQNPVNVISASPQTLPSVSSEMVEESLESSPDMNMEEPVRWSSLPDNLCRVCAQACTELEHVFSEKGEHLHLADLVHNHLPIMVTPDDLLPTHICTTCISKLQASESLVRTCIEADTTLRVLLDLPQSSQVQLCEPKSNVDGSEDMDVNGREDNIYAQEDDYADEPNQETNQLIDDKNIERGINFSSLLSQDDMSMIDKMNGDGLKVTLVRVPNLHDLPEEKKHQRVLQVLRSVNMNKHATQKQVKKKPSSAFCLTANISPVDDVFQDISAGSALRDKEVVDTLTLEEPQPEPSIFNIADVDPPLIDLTAKPFSSDLETDSLAVTVKSKSRRSTKEAADISVSADVPSLLRAELLDGINYAIKQGHVAKTGSGSIIKLNCKSDDSTASPSSVYVYVRNKDAHVDPKQIPRKILDLDILHQHQLQQQKAREKRLAAKAAKHQASMARRRARVREKRRIVSERKALTCEECGAAFTTKAEVTDHRMEHLKCQFCEKQFTKKLALVEHERVHTKEKPFICDQCGKTFRTRTQMVQHAQIHKTDGLYVCQICNREFSVRKTYLAHVETHSADSPFLCESCGKCFKVQSALRLHRLTHRSFNCNLCNKDFSYRAYQIHKKSHAGEESKFPCSYCNKKFLTSHRLKIHQLIHEAIYPFSCSVCRRSFKRMTHLQAHQARHTHEQLEGVSFFCCAICQVQYDFPGQLSQHIKTHSEEERQLLQSFRCPTCSKCFSVERELRSHELRHSGKQTFSCGTCNQAFDTKKEFDEHSDTHTEEKPFVCDVCGKRFRALVNLNNHQQIHLSFKPYPCQFCSKAFKTVNGLNQHKVVHSEVRRHTCGICSMGFKRRDAMKNHERTHFAERPYACSICGRAFKVKADCSTHLKRHREAGIEGTIMESCYSCPVCSANFSLKVELSTHVQSVHDMEVSVVDKDDNLVLVPDVDY